MSDILVELHASDPASNRRRAWRVVAGADLFGVWSACVTFGRIGCAGRSMRRDFETEAEVVRFVRRGLRRRATATRRLGVAYRTVEASPGADSLLALTGLRRVCEGKELPGGLIDAIVRNGALDGGARHNGRALR